MEQPKSFLIFLRNRKMPALVGRIKKGKENRKERAEDGLNLQSKKV